MFAPACSIRYAESDSKGMDIDIEIRGAVIADSFVCEVWPRFSHTRGVACEAQPGTLESAMTEPDSLKSTDSVLRIVDATKLFYGDEP